MIVAHGCVPYSMTTLCSTDIDRYLASYGATHVLVFDEDQVTCPRCRAALSARLEAAVRKALSDE